MTAPTEKAKITIHATARSKPGKEQELQSLCLGMLEPTRLEPGCIDYVLHADPLDPANFMFYENWASQAAFDAHIRSAHLQKFLEVSANLLESPVKITSWRIIG